MKKVSTLVLFGLISAPGLSLGAEQIDVEALKRELRELRQRTEQLERKLLAIEAGTTGATTTTTQPGPAPGAGLATPPEVRSGGSEEPKWSPSNPIQLGSERNYVNISLDVLTAAGTSTASDVEALQLGGHDPRQRGFTLQNAELTLEGMIDPYFRGQASTILFMDSEGETQVELEEAFLESLSLPWNLQLKAGQFLTEFGRINPSHPHTWDFVDSPLVNARFFGEDGLRNPGARLSWLVPTPFYSELFLAIQNSHGETAHSFRSSHEEDLFFGRPSESGRFRNVDDLLFTPRYAVSFDLSDTQTILAGASAAFGPNASGEDTRTEIYGVDLFWKWKPANHHGGFPFVSWQTEAMMRRFEAGEFNWDLNEDGLLDGDEMADPNTGLPALLPGERLKDYGLYSQIAFGFRKGWVAALRGDYVLPEERSLYENILGADPNRASRWRVSPNITYYPSEFSKIRLQYNFDHRNQIGDDHSIWLQFEFLLGSHSAHKF